MAEDGGEGAVRTRGEVEDVVKEVEEANGTSEEKAGKKQHEYAINSASHGILKSLVRHQQPTEHNGVELYGECEGKSNKTKLTVELTCAVVGKGVYHQRDHAEDYHVAPFYHEKRRNTEEAEKGKGKASVS